MNHIRNILEEVLVYYLKTRSVGHTKLMQKGIKNEDCIILAETLAQASNLRVEKKQFYISIQKLDIGGYRFPLVWDNSALIWLISEVLRDMNKKDKTIRELEEKIGRVVKAIR